MKEIIKKHILPDRTDIRWCIKFCLSMAAPLIILMYRPIGLNMRQSGVLAGVLLTIIWWSANIVKKIPASIFLVGVFCIVSGADYGEIFSFPLSETFPMLVVTYLFSQAISNVGILEKIIQPILAKLVHTPLQCVIAVVAVFFLMMYVVPQPLARLIIVAAMFDHFLKKTTLPQETRKVLMYSVFLFYAVVNMSSKDADMIMNYVAASFSDTVITNGVWIRGMFIPTLITCCLVILLFSLLFRKQMIGCQIRMEKKAEAVAFSRQQKISAGIIFATVVLWMTHSIHGINNTLVTLIAVVFLFAAGSLKKEDFKAIDVTTLIFLTAAFAIGGVMDACGAADKVFGLFSDIFPASFSVRYVVIMIGISMALHMILGSNTTTLSVVVPGMMILCGKMVPSPVIVFIAVISVSFHAVLPFHSVSMMIGASDEYFPSKYVTRFGIPATILVYLAIIGIYIPYWKLVGFLS